MKFDIKNILESFNSADVKVRYAILVMIIALVGVVDYFTVMALQRTLNKNMHAASVKMKSDIEHVKTDKQRLGQMHSNLGVQRKQLTDLQARIRPVGEMPAVLEDIMRLANANNLRVDQITPIRDKQKDIEHGDFHVVQIPIAVQMKGRFHAFGKFLNQLELNSILFVVQDMSLESLSPDKASDLKCILNMSVYFNP